MKRIFLLAIIVLQVSTIYGQSESSGSCENWDIVPYLYNDSISEQSAVCFWKNYWYERDTTTNLCFPETLIVCLHLLPGTELWEKDTKEMESCRVVSNLYFKLGEKCDSYNIVNGKNSEYVLLLDSVIDLKAAFNYIDKMHVGFINIATVKLPMREMLFAMNVFTNVWRQDILLESDKSFMLNQMIVETVVYGTDGVPCRRFDFSLPVNGYYCGNQL